MTENDLLQKWQAEAEKPFEGWDFSYLEGRYSEEKAPWSYETIVREALTDADAVLDMGTGGGEKLLEFKDVLPAQTFATEGYPPNFPVAQKNLQPHGIEVLPYDAEKDTKMPFEDGRFPLVINRHEAFNAEQIFDVLRPGGVFITQQVDGHHLADLNAHFGGEPQYPDVTLSVCRAALEAAGFSIEMAQEHKGKVRFADVSALVYYLSAVPWQVPDDFSVANYFSELLKLHAQPQPLEFTGGSFILQARKPQ